MDFIIDTHGQSSLLSKDKLIDSDDDLDFDFSSLNPADVAVPTIKRLKEKKKKKSSSKDFDLEEFEVAMGWENGDDRPKTKNVERSIDKIAEEVNPVDEVLQKSAIKPGYEQLESVPRYDVSRRIQRKERQKEREKTKGKKWYNMPATEMTPEIKHDLQVIQMRSVLDPKHFYKKNDLKALPKYFQVGKVMDSPLEYYNNRLSRKERKRTIVDELMADAEFAKYNKRKYKEIINTNRKLRTKAHQHAKRLKKKK